MRNANATWEIICCILRAGESQPLPRAKAGGWDIAGGGREEEKEESELAVRQELGEEIGEAHSIPSQKDLVGNAFFFKVIQHLFQARVLPEVLFDTSVNMVGKQRSPFGALPCSSFLMVIISNAVSRKGQDPVLNFSIALNIYWTSGENNCSSSLKFLISDLASAVWKLRSLLSESSASEDPIKKKKKSSFLNNLCRNTWNISPVLANSSCCAPLCPWNTIH